MDWHALDITSPKSDQYNCIAYVAGDFERVWNPDPLKIGYWPEGIPRRMTVTAFQNAFEALGYKLAQNHDLETGIEKIAIFEKNGKPTHAAKQLETGMWTSKLGRGHDVSHDLEGLEGEEYGQISLIMQRKIRS